ncbi:replication protein A 70 kDa DNA-binding subunit B [Tanacetum coccineum]
MYLLFIFLDVIGSVVAIGDVVPVQSSAGRKIRRTDVIEDAKSNQLDCTFWDHWATMIEVFTPRKTVVTIAEFFHGAVKKMVSTICKCEHKSHCIVYAKIHKIHKKSGWANTACKHYNKKVDVVETKATTSSGKSKVTFYCEDDGALMKKHIKDVDEYWLQELDELVGKRCDAFNDDADMIKHFKASFMDDESSCGDKMRVFIDLDNIESEDEDEDESGSSKTPKLISVKIEKED